jgi:hypothetical protein
LIDYSLLKRTAAKSNLSPHEILALAPQNDPFYVGAPRQVQKARWFEQIYSLMGNPPNCHIRRVHYWLVTTKAISKPNGQQYENTQNDWCLLTLAAKYARYLGLVPIENIIDRRNPDPTIYTQFWNHKKPSEVRDSIDEESIIESIVDQFYCYNPSLTQRYMIELWAEKSTMNDVLLPVCERYGANLVTGLGEMSITAVYLLAKRIVQANKPVRIFYISDFDPAGESMPVAVGRKIEYFARNYVDLADKDIKLIPLMLTHEQCIEYKLPRAPIKQPRNDHPAYTERKRKFEEQYGKGATELDAMEALYPGEMEKIISVAIEPFFDVKRWNEAVGKNREVRERVREYLLGGGICPNCDGERSFETDSDFTTVPCDMCNGEGTIQGKIGTGVMNALDTNDLDIYSPPQSSQNGNTSNHWLYSSNLEYIEQLERYREFKRGGENRTGVEELDRSGEENLDLYGEEE